MQIKVVGSANMAQVKAEFAAVTSQVNAMNAAMAEATMIPQGGNVGKFGQAQRAANGATMAFNNAAAASGAFRVEQIKINDAVGKHTELLQRQKLGMSQVFGKKSRDMMNRVYIEQLKMQQATYRINEQLVSDGKTRMSMAIPTKVHDSWDTLNNRVGMFRTRLASASAEMVNWGKNTQWAGRQLMAGISMPIAAFGAAAGVMAYQVDKQMTRIAKVYDTTADANSTTTKNQMALEKELSELRDAGMKTAVSAAKSYGSSVTDTLEVQAELAATGQTGARLQESTNQVMRISTLGEIDHAQATKALIALQATLGHTVKQTADDFNYMNSIENSTSLTTDDFTEAIPRALAPMKEMGGSLQDLAILMVAMKERGIQAGEGANAIKSMMQRLYRPSVQIRSEWEKLAGVDPLDFVEESGGNVMEMLPKIAEATKDLDKASRVKLLAGLFGTYQVTRISAMLKGLDDMKNGVGQTTRVLEVNSQAVKDWAATAEQELVTQAESASGKFIRVWQGLKAELTDVGDPFLDVASKFVSLASSALGFVNSMPGWAKKGLIFGAMLAALVGPVVMLIGLFANFAGNMGSFVAWSLKAVTSFEFLNKAQWAAKVSAELADRAFLGQASAAEILEQQLRGIALASEQSAIALSNLAKVPLPPNFQTLTAEAKAVKVDPADVEKPKYTPTIVPAYVSPTVDQLPETRKKFFGLGKSVPDQKNIAANIANQRSAEAMARAQHEASVSAAVIENKAKATEHIQAKTKGHINGMVVGSAAMAASMVLMTGAAGDTGQEIGKWLMIASVVAPAVSSMSAPLALMGNRFRESAKSAMKTASNSAAAGVELRRAAGSGAALSAGLKGAGKGIMGMMGPLGWTVAAFAGIAATFMILKGRQEEIARKEKERYDKQLKANKALANTAKDFATNIGKAGEAYNTMLTGGPTVFGSGQKKTMLQQSYDYYKNNEQGIAAIGVDEKGKTVQGGLKDSIDGDPEALASRISATFIDLQKLGGLSARDAMDTLQGMLIAMGKSGYDAEKIAQGVYDKFGDIKDLDWGDAIKTNADALGESYARIAMEQGAGTNIDVTSTGRVTTIWEKERADFDRAIKGIEPQAKAAAMMFSEALGSALSPEEGQRYITEFMESATSRFTAQYESMLNIPALKQMLVDAGVESGSDLAAAFNDGRIDGDKLRSVYMAADDNGINQKNYFDPETMENMLEMASQYEQTVVGALSANTDMSDEIVTAKEATAALVAEGRNMTFAQAKENAKDLIGNLHAAKQTLKDAKQAAGGIITEDTIKASALVEATEETSKAAINAINLAKGFKTGATAAEALKNLVNKVEGETAGAVAQAKKLGNAWSNMSFDAPEVMLSVKKESIEAVMSELSDARNKVIDDAMNAAMDGAQEGWDRRQKNLEAQQAAATERFENRYERMREAVEKRYDAQLEGIDKSIKAEQKAEEIRQRIFEAEQTRLDRLTDAANRGIDFNVALQTGDLDEAAKIRNDMDATAQEWALADGAEKGARGSEKRVNKLEGRQADIEDRKDAELKALDKREEAERKHLEKVQQMRADSLAKQAKANMDFLKKDWDQKKASSDAQLKLLAAMPISNKKQLDKALKESGLSIADFGFNTSEAWGTFFKNSMNKNTRLAGLEIAKGDMWKKVGERTSKQMLFGMGFGSIAKFEKFIRTGELPDDFGNPTKPKKPVKGKGKNNSGVNTDPSKANPGQFHKGGSIDGGAGSGRSGVARTHKGLHNSEVMIRAQKGEFMVNRDAASKHGDVLDAINSGVYDSGVMGGASQGGGMAGLMAGVMSKLFAVGVGKAVQNAVARKKMQNTLSNSGPSAGAFGSIKAGQYGETNFTAEQLSNAQTIASVGRSLGASSRDIVIALMTAMQESTLRNLDYGDRDSVGLFQQRNAWGSFAARTNPAESARMFFKGGAAGQRGLFDFSDRDSMSLAEAAQSVQVSAFPDAYAKWADEAKAIYSALGKAGTSSGGYIPGKGGKHRPINAATSRNLHGTETGYPAYDFSTKTGTPVRAVSDGVISRSYDIAGPLASDTYKGTGPYGSYGRVIYLKTDAGPEVLYAHLSKRSVSAGQRVAGGSTIGYSGNTGNSSGAHLHFGATNGPMAWLKKGGTTLNDGMAMLHRGETVLTDDLSQDLQTTVKAFGKVSRDALSGKSKAKAAPAPMGVPGGSSVAAPSGFWTWISGWTETVKAALAGSSTSGNGVTSASGEPSSSGALRAGSYNLDNKFGEIQRKQMSMMMGRADLLGLSDFSGGGKKNMIDWIRNQGWGYWGPQGDAPVLWNKEVLNFRKGGSRALDPKSPGRSGYVNYAQLSGLGKPFWAASTHTAAHTGANDPKSGAQTKVQREQFATLRQLTGELRKSGEVVMMGDFNEDLRQDTIDVPGLTSAWIGNMTKGGGTLGNRYIDHVMATSGLKLTGAQLVKGMAGLHKGAALAQYDIPGLSKGAMNIDVGGLARLHKDEGVLTKDLNQKFKQGVDNFASGATTEYNLNMTITEPGASADEIASKIMTFIERKESRKPTKRSS